MISCALGMCCESVNELMVGTMMSRFPFTTSVGWAILLSSPKRSARTSFHSAIAASCAFIVCAELGGSMSFVRRWRRSQKALPAAWLLVDGEKNKWRKASSPVSPVVPTEKSIRTGRVNVRGTGRADGQRRDGPRRSAVAGRDAVAGAYARPAGRSVPSAGARRGRSRVSGRSLVPVMEAAEDGSGDDARTVFRAADCAAVRRVLREREMRPRRVVVLGVPAQQSAGVALAEDDHKVEQIAPDGADHPFGEGILPRRPRRADDLLLAAEAMEE